MHVCLDIMHSLIQQMLKSRETAKDSLKLPKFLSSRLLAKWHSLS